MGQLIPNSFSTFELSEAEQEAGSIINYNQKMVLQNKLSEIATQKINAIYDPQQPLEFAQNISYLQGQLDVINWLLDTSSVVEAEVKQRVADKEVS
jgi:hypothetical protein